MSAKQSASPSPRVQRLLQFLDIDPTNPRLLEDTAQAAFEDGATELASELIGRAPPGPLPPSLANLKGMIAIARQDFCGAIAVFESLREEAGDDPALRFNLAWAKAMAEDYEGALLLLDDAAVAVSPRAPRLKVQMFHHLGQYDEGLAWGETLARQFPTDLALMGAIATLALDADRADLAAQYAELGGSNDDASTVRAFLGLSRNDGAQSAALFDRAISERPENARAWIGKGLSQLKAGDIPAGTKAIDRGAELFKVHVGSWVASGWAHFLMGDYDGARASFECALAINDKFAECHGGLAVIDAVQGNFVDAERRSEIARRLDKTCFGAALAKILLLQKSGHAEMARRVRDIALTSPIGPNGETLADAIVGFGFARPH